MKIEIKKLPEQEARDNFCFSKINAQAEIN